MSWISRHRYARLARTFGYRQRCKVVRSWLKTGHPWAYGRLEAPTAHRVA